MMMQPASRHRAPSPAMFQMAEFDTAAASRSVADLLEACLEDAESQLRMERRLARRAERRVHELARAVENWRDLIDDYERLASVRPDDRRN